MVKRPTEKPGAVLTEFESTVREGSFLPDTTSSTNCKHWFTTSFLRKKVPESDAGSVLPVQTLLSCSYSPRVQRYCINIWGYFENPQTLAAIPLFGHAKILLTMIGMGSAALKASVSCQGQATRIYLKGQVLVLLFGA